MRGNGKIIQELEGVFKGAGWNVIKVIWGSRWDQLLRADVSGRLVQLMTECVDGDYQTFKSRNGKYVRDEFFGRYPETKAMVEEWSDDEIWALQRGGHDSLKVYAAYKAASEHRGAPTVVLAKTIKGYGMGEAGEAQNIAHQAKKMEIEAMRTFRDRFDLPIPDEAIAGEKVPFYKPPEDSAEMRYLRERSAALGSVPQRRRALGCADRAGTLGLRRAAARYGRPHISTTMAFVRMLNTIARDKRDRRARRPDRRRRIAHVRHGRNVPPARDLLVGRPALPSARCRAADVVSRGQARANPAGGHQRSRRALVVDRRRNLVLESQPADDSVLHLLLDVRISTRGRSDVGRGRQPHARISARRDLRADDAQRRGTAARRRQQPSRGLVRSRIAAATIRPTRTRSRSIIQDGLRRMLAEQEDVYYYITLMNENYQHPAMPAGARDGILRGMYLLQDAGKPPMRKTLRVQLFGSGAILREVIAAAELLADDWNVAQRRLGRDQLQRAAARRRRRTALEHAASAGEAPALVCRGVPARPLAARASPRPTTSAPSPNRFVRSSVGRRYVALGTDGYGRSDFRRKLREFFEVDRHFVTIAALRALADEGTIPPATVEKAIEKYDIDPNKPNPIDV